MRFLFFTQLTSRIYKRVGPRRLMIAGMSGTVAVNGETLMQCYKTGKIVGSNNRSLTILQLVSVPIGSLAVALVYPALKLRYGIGGNGLTSPISVNVSRLLLTRTTAPGFDSGIVKTMNGFF